MYLACLLLLNANHAYLKKHLSLSWIHWMPPEKNVIFISSVQRNALECCTVRQLDGKPKITFSWNKMAFLQGFMNLMSCQDMNHRSHQAINVQARHSKRQGMFLTLTHTHSPAHHVAICSSSEMKYLFHCWYLSLLYFNPVQVFLVALQPGFWELSAQLKHDK